MKQKIVIKVSMNDHKTRTKAMKVAVGISGVELAALEGEDKSQIVVTGENIDAVELAKSLRKNVGPADLLTVEEKKEEKKDEKKDDDKSKVQPMIWLPPDVPTYQIYGVPVPVTNQYPEPSSCSIM